MLRLRGAEMAMVFQDPMSSLNPAFTVGNLLSDGPAPHNDEHARARARAAVELLDRVGIPDPEARLRSTHTSSPAGCASAR